MDLNNDVFETKIIQGSKHILSNKQHQKEYNANINNGAFPKTRYYGSKLRLIDWITTSISMLEFSTALDAFGGTATVSLMLKSKGKIVTYNDALTSNQHVANAILSATSTDFKEKEIKSIVESVKPLKGFIYNTFDGYYYNSKENQWLDGVTPSILRRRDQQLKSDLFYCLFQSCLQKRPFNLFHRKNYYIRANCSRTTKFGNWRTWERTFEELMIRASYELKKAKEVSIGSAIVLPAGDASEIESGFDLVYIDPPYLKNENNSLTYLDRYHFLEGLCNYHGWDDLINKESYNLRFKQRPEIYEWNNKKYFRDRLFDMISEHKQSILILSYATGGYPSANEILKHFKSSFKNVFMVSKNISHALHSGKKEEIMIIGY